MASYLYSSARNAARTAKEWEAMACRYDRAWAEKCLREAAECRERAARYLRLNKDYQSGDGNHEQH